MYLRKLCHYVKQKIVLKNSGMKRELLNKNETPQLDVSDTNAGIIH